MFTGIVEGLGRVEALNRIGEGLALGLRPLFEFQDPCIGESISVDGVCLTLTRMDKGLFWMDISHETISRSTLGHLRVEDPVNLERALRVGDRLGGHIVLGHVDAVGVVTGIRPVERSFVLGIRTEPGLAPYMVEKGSVTINGVSLTINTCKGGAFEVNIVPHTWEVTNLRFKGPGSKVNIEVDILAKYVYSILKGRAQGPLQGKEGITEEKMKKFGFGV